MRKTPTCKAIFIGHIVALKKLIKQRELVPYKAVDLIETMTRLKDAAPLQTLSGFIRIMSDYAVEEPRSEFASKKFRFQFASAHTIRMLDDGKLDNLNVYHDWHHTFYPFYRTLAHNQISFYFAHQAAR